ncbi:MAG: hypothetical protein AB1778_06590 [Candidatus Bipolaricaulota bacterium]
MVEAEADLIVEWYLEVETRLRHFLESIPYRHDTRDLPFVPLASIFLDTCSILDGVFRALSSRQEDRSQLTIAEFAPEYEARLGLGQRRSLFLRFPSAVLRPFKDWVSAVGTYQKLSWWSDHNDLKHDRVAASARATLANCTSSVCALQQVLSQLPQFFQASTRHGLLHFGTLNVAWARDNIYDTPGHQTILFESQLFATPIGARCFPDAADAIDPISYGNGERLWRFMLPA